MINVAGFIKRKLFAKKKGKRKTLMDVSMRDIVRAVKKSARKSVINVIRKGG